MGVLVLPTSAPVLSAGTLMAIQNRVLTGLGMEAIALRAGMSLVRPTPLKLIPYVGLAIAVGWVLYDTYRASQERTPDWAKMEAETYDPEDMAAFRMGFSEARGKFEATEDARAVARRGAKFILIPSQAMPMIARVDTVGMAEYGDLLQWDPLNAASRRRAAIAGRGPAGQTPDASGAVVRGSWEEYPFAATRGLARQGSHVDRVPLFENWIQGGFIRAADMAQGFTVGDRIVCVIM